MSERTAHVNVAARRSLVLSPAAVLLGAMTLLVIVVHLLYMLTVRTGVPHQDEWTALYGMFQSHDHGRITQWVLEPRNGHFVVPSKIGYLLSWRMFQLDLTALRLLNLPICLAAFLLVAYVIKKQIQRAFVRPYLYLGAAFIIFNLAVWEHFSQAGAFSAILSAVLGCAGVYWVTRGASSVRNLIRDGSVAFLLFALSILSFGFGYAALLAAIATVAILAVRRWIPPLGKLQQRWVAWSLFLVSAAIAAASHPMFHLSGKFFRFVYHALLVMGSMAASAFESPPMALNAGYIFGLIALLISVWIVIDFLIRTSARHALMPRYAVGVVLCGVAACGAVAAARTGLPDGEFLASRYTLQASVVLLGTMLYTASARLFLLSHVWCLVAVSYLLPTIKEWQVGPHRPAAYANIEAAIKRAETLTDAELQGALYWSENTTFVRDVVVRFKSEHLNVYRDQR